MLGYVLCKYFRTQSSYSYPFRLSAINPVDSFCFNYSPGNEISNELRTSDNHVQDSVDELSFDDLAG